MRRYLLFAVLAVVAIGSLAFPAIRSAAEQGGEYVPTTQTLFPDQEKGLLSFGDQTYAPVAAPEPFSHLLMRRVATVPDGASLMLMVRVSNDAQTWSDWGIMEPNDDFGSLEDGPDVVWSQIFEAGGLAAYWQVRAVMTPDPLGIFPELRQIDVSTVETLSGPVITPAESAASEGGTTGRVGIVAPDREAPEGGPMPQAAMPMAISKPPVVSRTSWGSPDGQGSRAAPKYYSVNHLVIHHTADSNSLRPGEINWAARVRAIWSYHTITQKWGDIGYNYLIDPNGVIYEGRAGGDNAVGFHDTGNYGSMGVSLLGTYQSVAPSEAAQDALVRLLAWKSSQRGIDPLGQSYYYGCTISSYCLPFNDGGIVLNIAGHRQVTPGHTTCPGDAFMALMPGIRERVRQLIAQGEPPSAQIALTGVSFPRTTIAAGELLEIQMTVRNTGEIAVVGQAPEVDLGQTSSFSAYVYRQHECFNGSPGGTTPAFPKESGKVRVVLGTSDWDSANAGLCNGATSNYPWRWGLNGSLAPGEERTVIGYIQFQSPGIYALQSGLLQEYVGYTVQGAYPTQITVTDERGAPEVAAYNSQLRPLAQVYQLGNTPDNLLSRITSPGDLVRGQHVGSFPWSGEMQDWGYGGPLGLSDRFLVTQVRTFTAPTSGAYTFRLTSDDGSWLLVDGQVVAANAGLHPAQTAAGTIQLSVGAHTLSIIAFEAGEQALLSYDYQPPGSDFMLLPDPIATQVRDGASFPTPPDLFFAADDLGVSGVSRMRWSLNGGEWLESPGALLRPGRLQTGSYILRYQAIDIKGNQSPVQELRFGVAAPAPEYTYRTFLPIIDH